MEPRTKFKAAKTSKIFIILESHVGSFESGKKYLPTSLLQVPSIMFSSILKICRPGKPFAHPRPTRSRIVDL